MKKILVLSILAAAYSAAVMAQDVLITEDGESITAYDVEISAKQIFYKEAPENSDFKSIIKDKVVVWKKNDGTKVRIEKGDSVSVDNTKTEKKEYFTGNSIRSIGVFASHNGDEWTRGVSYTGLKPNGYNWEASFRHSNSNQYGNYNFDVGANVSLALINGAKSKLLLTLSAGPSIRYQGEVDGCRNDKYCSDIKEGLHIDAYIHPRLVLCIKHCALIYGYHFWQPDFRFDSKYGDTSGQYFGISYAF